MPTIFDIKREKRCASLYYKPTSIYGVFYPSHVSRFEQSMTGIAYEALVQSLLQQLVRNTSLATLDIQGGSRNRIIGASGYRHQIDVSARGPSLLCLVEAKHWSKSVGVESILVLASRIADIQAKTPDTQTQASIVSIKRATRGAAQLAPHFGISIDVVSSMEEYAVQLANKLFIGLRADARVSSSVEFELRRPAG